MDDDWQQMMCGPLVEEEVPLTGGRTVPARVGRVSGGPTRTKLKTFASFCSRAQRAEGRLSAGDYALLATAFSAVRIEGAPGVPRFTLANEDEARRFINLVDVLYEKRRLLVADLGGGAGAFFDEGAGVTSPGGGAGGGGRLVARGVLERASVGVARLRGGGIGGDWVESETARRVVRAAARDDGQRVDAVGRRGREQRAVSDDGRGDGSGARREAGRRAR